jgi:hypothetical protein
MTLSDLAMIIKNAIESIKSYALCFAIIHVITCQLYGLMTILPTTITCHKVV